MKDLLKAERAESANMRKRIMEDGDAAAFVGGTPTAAEDDSGSPFVPSGDGHQHCKCLVHLKQKLEEVNADYCRVQQQVLDNRARSKSIMRSKSPPKDDSSSDDEKSPKQKKQKCVCGNKFKGDSQFCRKCGTARPGHSPSPEGYVKAYTQPASQQEAAASQACVIMCRSHSITVTDRVCP